MKYLISPKYVEEGYNKIDFTIAEYELYGLNRDSFYRRLKKMRRDFESGKKIFLYNGNMWQYYAFRNPVRLKTHFAYIAERGKTPAYFRDSIDKV